MMSDDERVKQMRESKERNEIVAKYDLGREEGAEIDAWEDPAFEVYHVTDHYGFIHQERVPEELVKLNTKLLEKDLNRVKKWLAMTKDETVWGKCVKNNKVTERTYKGIPEKVRGLVWCMMLGVKSMMEKNKGVYENMKELSKTWSPYVKQIDLDINRTFRDHITFRRRYDIKQQALFNVLCAYSVFDEDVGYCQGMSEIAALLLMYMNEEEAFWCLSVLMTNKKHSMRGFFLPSFPKLIRFKDHHDELIRKKLKKVKKHLDKNDIHTMTYCIKWFMQCFLDRVPFSLALRLWDIYVWEGEGLLVAMAFTIIRLQRDRLLQLADEEILKFFQSGLANNFGSNDEFVVQNLKHSISDLKLSNKLLPPQPTDPDGPEGFKKKLGSFTPPQIFENIIREVRGDSEAIGGALPRNGAVVNLENANGQTFNRNTRVSIPADGGPEIGVEALIYEGENGWRTLDRFASQEFSDDLLDRSDHSPSLRLRSHADDGLSSCTSLASHSCYDEEFGDDEANRIRSGSLETLNGAEMTDPGRTADDTYICDRFAEQMEMKSESEGEASAAASKTKSNNFLSTNHLVSDKTFADPENLSLNMSSDISSSYASYKTTPSPSVASSNFDLYKYKPNFVVPYASTSNHAASMNQMTNQKMPYSQSTGNVKSPSSSVSHEESYFPRYQSNDKQNYVAPPMHGTNFFNPVKKTNFSTSSSYLGRKVQHKNLPRDPLPDIKQDVSVVVIGNDKDVIIKGNIPLLHNPSSSKYPLYENPITYDKICMSDKIHRRHGSADVQFGPATRNIIEYNMPRSFVTGGNSSLPHKNSILSVSNSRGINTNQNVQSSTSDYSTGTGSPSGQSLNRFVSPFPLVEHGFYHPDSKGVTRVWTGDPVSTLKSNSHKHSPVYKQTRGIFSNLNPGDDTKVVRKPMIQDRKLYYTQF